MTTGDLLAALRRRDPRAQERLRELMLGRLEALCTRMLGDGRLGRETASDIVIDFCIDHVDRIQSEKAIAAYLKMIAVRRCVRLREWRGRMEPEPVLADPAADLDGVLEARERQRDQELLRACIERLPAPMRQVLRMRFYRDMTQEQIGAHFGFTKQYAGRLLAKALEKLRVEMERRR